MSTQTIQSIETYTVIVCNSRGCGLSFALADSFIRARSEDHATWYCPNGHPRHYPQKTEAEKLRDEVERLERGRTYLRSRVDQAEADAKHQRSRAAGYKGQLAKTKKRIGKGVCPCCSRHFANVERHMANQHPDYVAEEPRS